MVKINIVVAKTKEFPTIEKVLALNIFLRIIYTIIPKLLAIISTIV